MNAYRCKVHGKVPRQQVYEAEGGGFGHSNCWQGVEVSNIQSQEEIADCEQARCLALLDLARETLERANRTVPALHQGMFDEQRAGHHAAHDAIANAIKSCMQAAHVIAKL